MRFKFGELHFLSPFERGRKSGNSTRTSVASHYKNSANFFNDTSLGNLMG